VYALVVNPSHWGSDAWLLRLQRSLSQSEVSDGTPPDRRRTQQVRADARPLRPQLREAPSGALQDPAAAWLPGNRGAGAHSFGEHRGRIRRKLDHRAPDGRLLEVPPRLLQHQDPLRVASAGSAKRKRLAPTRTPSATEHV